jgi:hypothetical protein
LEVELSKQLFIALASCWILGCLRCHWAESIR